MSESTTSHTHFHSMTDSQLHQAINQLSAAGKVQQTPGQVAHPGKSTSVFLVLQELKKIILVAYFNNIRQWSTSVTPPPTNGRTNPTRTRSRLARGSSLAPAPPQPTASTSTQQPIPPPAQSAPTPVPPLIPEYPTAHRRVHIPLTTQAHLILPNFSLVGYSHNMIRTPKLDEDPYVIPLRHRLKKLDSRNPSYRQLDQARYIHT